MNLLGNREKWISQGTPFQYIALSFYIQHKYHSSISILSQFIQTFGSSEDPHLSFLNCLESHHVTLYPVGVAFFTESLEKYHGQHKETLAIKQKRHLGLLLVDTTLLKGKLIPSPLRCLKVGGEDHTITQC